MERVTGFLELLGILLVVLAVGWQFAEVTCVPLGLCASAVTAWLASWLLQGARMPARRGRDPKGARR